MVKVKKKKKNTADLTLRNLRASKKKYEALKKKVQKIESLLDSLRD